jgi:hypothetical protein
MNLRNIQPVNNINTLSDNDKKYDLESSKYFFEIFAIHKRINFFVKLTKETIGLKDLTLRETF